MARYRLTRAADRDFENIFEFGIANFGLTQALEYQIGLRDRFAQLAAQPDLYQAVDHIREGYRRSVFRAHSIYYKANDGEVLIVRILGREDPEGSLPG
jgi:toxin ParE1/3/4